MNKATSAILTGVYPKVSNSLQKSLPKYKQNIAKFMEVRSKDLYDIAPFSRINFSENDYTLFYNTMGIAEADIKEEIKKTYYGNISAFSPKAAKDELTVASLCCIRYFLLKKMDTELNLSCIYLAFSGKFYPSIHYGSYKRFQPSEYRHVMEYVVNNELSQKFDLKREGTLIGAIKSITNTWVSAYEDRFKEFSDEDVVYLIQQLHSRISSFMHNIAEKYYDVYSKKDIYLTYDSDNVSDDNFHMADNDQFKGDRYIESTMNVITTQGVDYKLCKMSSNADVKTDEVKFIIESIQSDKENIILVKEMITIMIYEFLQQSKTKEITGQDFIAFCLVPKPNTRNKNILRQKEIVRKFLMEGSPQYRKRKNRLATANNYERCILTYYTLLINQSNK